MILPILRLVLTPSLKLPVFRHDIEMAVPGDLASLHSALVKERPEAVSHGAGKANAGEHLTIRLGVKPDFVEQFVFHGEVLLEEQHSRKRRLHVVTRDLNAFQKLHDESLLALPCVLTPTSTLVIKNIFQNRLRPDDICASKRSIVAKCGAVRCNPRILEFLLLLQPTQCQIQRSFLPLLRQEFGRSIRMQRLREGTI